jgi:hypothetical protein
VHAQRFDPELVHALDVLFAGEAPLPPAGEGPVRAADRGEGKPANQGLFE